MTPLWLALPAALACAALGATLLRVALRGARPASALEQGSLATGAGLFAVYLMALSPAASVLAIAAVVFFARRRTVFLAAAASSTQSTRAIETRTGRGLTIVFALVVVVALASPATPTYWDEFVWLAKSRLECAGWGSLRAAALDPAVGVVPQGYPLLWSLAAAWFGARVDRPDALVAGATASRLLVLALFFSSLQLASRAHAAARTPGVRTTASTRFAPVALVLLATTPLVLVHLRSVHADLPIGLLAAGGSLALACALDPALDRATRAGAWTLGALSLGLGAALKDEGSAHALAALLALGVTHRRALRALPALRVSVALVAVVAFAPAVLWRALLALHGVRNTDHALAGPALRDALPLVRSAFAQVVDVVSWGALPAMLIAYGLVRATERLWSERQDMSRARGPRRRDPLAAQLALALALQTLAVYLGVLLGPDRVREFARDGTLWNRLALQLAPTGALLLARALTAPPARLLERRPAEPQERARGA